MYGSTANFWFRDHMTSIQGREEPVYAGDHSDLKNIRIGLVSPELFPFYKVQS